jgi:hypothetical protein
MVGKPETEIRMPANFRVARDSLGMIGQRQSNRVAPSIFREAHFDKRQHFSMAIVTSALRARPWLASG